MDPKIGVSLRPSRPILARYLRPSLNDVVARLRGEEPSRYQAIRKWVLEGKETASQNIEQPVVQRPETIRCRVSPNAAMLRNKRNAKPFGGNLGRLIEIV